MLEVFPEKFPADENPDECYAYITFTDSTAAATACDADVEFGSILIPADTWKQPASIEESQRPFDESVLRELDDDCLLLLFGHCDLPTLINLCRTSERLSNHIRGHIYPKFFRLEITIDSKFSLASFRETMRHIGPHLINVRIVSHVRKEKRNYREDRIIDIFTKYIGDKIERLELGSIQLNERALMQLKPVLLRLRELKGEVRGNGFPINLARLCPRLERLDIFSQQNIVTVGTDSWPTLRAIHLHIDNSGSGLILRRRFLEKNPQLTELTLGAGFGHGDVDPFCEENVRKLLTDEKYLHNLEVLTVRFRTSALDMVPLNNSPKLRELSFTEWRSKGNLYSTLKQLSTFPALTHLRLTYDFYTVHVENVISADFEMAKLHHFTLKNCKLTETNFIRIIEVSPALQEFEVNLFLSKIRVNAALLMKMVEIRNIQARKSGTPVVRLKLSLGYFCDNVDELIMQKVRKIRSGQDELDDRVILSFPMNDKDIPYCAEMAEVISIEIFLLHSGI